MNIMPLFTGSLIAYDVARDFDHDSNHQPIIFM